MSTSSSTAGAKGANYHRKCTGQALTTVQLHSSHQPLTLYGAAFCPFVHRVWIALEYLQVPYQYIEVDPYEKPQSLLDVNPKGLVPSLRIEDEGRKTKGLGESTVILEYLQERYVDAPQNQPGAQRTLLPSLFSSSTSSSSDNVSAVYARAQHRLVCHHLNSKLIPAFYRFLQAQEADKQIEYGNQFTEEIMWFQQRLQEADQHDEGEVKGDFFGGQSEIGWTDMMLAPWAFRATNVLYHFRSLSLDSPSLFPPGSRYHRWTQAVFSHPAFKATTSTEDLYLDSYARYAENRPNTSQVARAINEGSE